jgi:DNA-binding CsgD family transcriptional regulator
VQAGTANQAAGATGEAVFNLSGPTRDRVAELRCFTEAAAGLAAGHQSVIEVVGAAGTGKTSLLAAAVDRISRPGLLIRTGSAAESERQIPFSVFLHAFGQWPHGNDEQFWEDAGRRAAGSPLSIEQFGLCRDGRRRIAARARGGLVLVLDDLQWADRMSQDLIAHLLRYPLAVPLLLVLAYRPEPAVGWETGPAARAGLGDPGFRWLHLEPPEADAPETDPPAPLDRLTARQQEIARLAGTGATTRLIARQLSVSPRTVDAHLARIYRLLDVPSRAGLASIVAHG